MHKIIHDVETGLITEIELTPEEIAENTASLLKVEKEEKIMQEQARLKADAKIALLDKLGITESEASLLLS